MIDGMNTDKAEALVRKFGTAENVYKASYNDYKETGLFDGQELKALADKRMNRVAEAVEKMRLLGGNIITYQSSSYPPLLKCISDPPLVLYTRGTIPKWNELAAIGVVGTRNYSDYGVKATRHICTGLARAGITIVSGMARGIDSVAAKSALDMGMKTIAVLGCGVDVVYPPENERLMMEIINNGLVISEYPPGTQPIGKHFPVRNRIISGLSQGVLICEAPEKSGALITAGLAADNNRDVFAIPGDISKYNYRGCNKLIQMGAKLVTEAEDILEEYAAETRVLKLINKSRAKKVYAPSIKIDEDSVNRFSVDMEISSLERDAKASEDKPAKGEVPAERRKGAEELTDDVNEREIIRILENGMCSVDDIAEKTDIDIAVINSCLVVMEMNGITERMPGNLYKLKE